MESERDGKGVLVDELSQNTLKVRDGVRVAEKN